MPTNKELFKTFFKVCDDADMEHLLKDDPACAHLLKLSEKFGKDMEESVNNFICGKKKIANPQNVIPPDNLQTAYIAPAEESPLYNVMTEGRKPVLKKSQNIFKKLSFGIEDWDLKLTAKNNEDRYSLLVGEHVGVELKFNNNSSIDKSLNLDYNVQNKKLQARFEADTPVQNFSTAVFSQHGKIGASASFNQKPANLGINLSADRDNMAASINWYKSISNKYDCRVSLYGNYGFKQKKDNVVGIYFAVIGL